MTDIKKPENFEYPRYCDYFCKFASFSGKEIVGDCRKELAVWCKLYEKYNNKNSACIGLKENKSDQ
ncbi:MAG: hypothetical protein HUU43_16355 [Ignavibacteriaceae bacterium]|nr:hypothetical protein [Ignavibacteriaceae bacterium]NUM72418.1 hypothetical protein [Ignavibacteriaceae bacterium]